MYRLFRYTCTKLSLLVSLVSGFSTATSLPHTGLLYQSDLVQSQPHSLRRKILSIIANKVVLLARIDSYSSHNSTTNGTVTGIDNSQGVRMRREIEEKIDKFHEAPKARTKKALPVPEEKSKKRRGGGMFVIYTCTYICCYIYSMLYTLLHFAGTERLYVVNILHKIHECNNMYTEQ